MTIGQQQNGFPSCQYPSGCVSPVPKLTGIDGYALEVFKRVCFTKWQTIVTLGGSVIRLGLDSSAVRDAVDALGLEYSETLTDRIAIMEHVGMEFSQRPRGTE